MAKNEEKKRKAILEAYTCTGSIRQTARQQKVTRQTVRRVLYGRRRPPVEHPPAPSKLDPFRPTIQRLVLDDRLTATLVLDEIRELGYQGGYSILKDYVRLIRPRSKTKVTTRLEHPPGAEGQADWSPYTVRLGGEQRLVHAFSLVLPFSRFMVVRFAFDETLGTLLRLHDEAFGVIGAIPKLMTYDNMTTVGRHVGQDRIELNRRFDAYRKECGFEVAQTLQQGYATFLAGLVQRQVLASGDAAAQRRINAAKFPETKTFDTYDWTFQKGLNIQLVKDLMNLDFIPQARPLLLLGKPGTGKSHISISYGQLAAMAGYTVRFFTASRLLSEFYASLADASTDRMVARLARVNLLIIDDLRDLPPRAEYAGLLYEVIDARYRRRSTIVSSNLSVKQWGKALGNPVLTASLVDRLMERGHVINIKRGRSYRTFGPEAPPETDWPALVTGTATSLRHPREACPREGGGRGSRSG